MPPNRWAVVASAWVNSSNSFACCSGVMPMPVSETDSSIQWPPLLTLRPRSAHLALLGELAGIAQQVEQNLPQPHGVDSQGAEVLRGLDDQAVLVLLGELARGADHLVDQRRELHRSAG